MAQGGVPFDSRAREARKHQRRLFGGVSDLNTFRREAGGCGSYAKYGDIDSKKRE